jgi:hypothetical protein
MADLDQAVAYLTWWFQAALSDPQSEEMEIVLATIRGGKIDFEAFESPSEAAAWAVEQSAHTNVYTHVALHTPDRPKGKGTTETALCLPGVVVDLDARSPFRGSNEGKAPDVASLHQVISDFEKHYPFSLALVESGFGLHGHARFREPLWLVDAKTRVEADNLLTRFTEGMRVFARQRGWPNAVDRVPLAGLVRVPGTFNRKGDPPLPVRFADRSGVGR